MKESRKIYIKMLDEKESMPLLVYFADVHVLYVESKLLGQAQRGRSGGRLTWPVTHSPWFNWIQGLGL